MPQPTRPASVMMTQYCPLCQRLLIPTAQPFLNCSGRDMVRGSGSLIAGLPFDICLRLAFAGDLSNAIINASSKLLDHARMSLDSIRRFGAAAKVPGQECFGA